MLTRTNNRKQRKHLFWPIGTGEHVIVCEDGRYEVHPEERVWIRGRGDRKYMNVCICVVVKIMVPLWIPIIIRHLIFRVPKRGS